MSENRFTVEHRPDERRYALIDTTIDGGPVVIGEESYVDVAAEGSGSAQRVMFHTGVSEEYSGQGLASVLVDAAVTHAIGAGFRIVPVCPYVKAWLPKHPEYADHVDDVQAMHLRAVRDQQ